MHGKHFVRGVTMQKERLAEKRKKPMRQEKVKNDHIELRDVEDRETFQI